MTERRRLAEADLIQAVLRRYRTQQMYDSARSAKELPALGRCLDAELEVERAAIETLLKEMGT